MIKEVHLHNWKSFGDAVFYIDPLTAVIGTNSSGKSNLLDALVFLKELASGAKVTNLKTNSTLRIGNYWLNWHEGQTGFVKIVLEIDSKSYEYLIRFGKELGKNKQVGIIEEFFGRLNEDGQTERIYKLTSTAQYFAGSELSELGFLEEVLIINRLAESTENKPIKDEEFELTEKLEKILKSIVFINPVSDSMRNYKQVSSNLESDASNIAGVLASFPDNEKAEIESRLSQYMSKILEKDLVKVTAEKVGKLGKDAMLYCEENWNNQEEPTIIDASTMSDGTFRFLAIVATLLISKEGSLILIEEVDNGLHPSRAEYLIKVLLELGREKKIDIVFTTHNPALLDALGTEMIPFISVVHRNPTTGNSEITLLEDIEQLPKLMASGSIGKLASQGKIEESLKYQTQAK